MSREARLSARLRESVAERLDAQSERTQTSRSRLVERYIDEGLRMDEHPGIIFRDGPTGRRAGLVAGPDVWEVMAVIRGGDRKGEAAVRHAAKWLDLREDQVRAVVRYYADYQVEIDERIRLNEEEAATAEAAWLRGQAALS